VSKKETTEVVLKK